MARRERRIVLEVEGVRHDRVDDRRQVKQRPQSVTGGLAATVFLNQLPLDIRPPGFGQWRDPWSVRCARLSDSGRVHGGLGAHGHRGCGRERDREQNCQAVDSHRSISEMPVT
jgi:hypothetical protein